ncbi:hypothetical protein OCHUTO_0034 [Orientia chuto str. Dubai]|uniref:Uncharacterized protein n=1 Tax=Orientia chuto str. Dubai TaxID=1359168 RepID=A0A0F3MNZ7_9RICK|nr:hypothetical protein [Candidatus Orientia mediorientalis]KJV57503.1 hypothetical protein OCHUTO_0034 [Orientia chuto str. Dubai]
MKAKSILLSWQKISCKNKFVNTFYSTSLGECPSGYFSNRLYPNDSGEIKLTEALTEALMVYDLVETIFSSKVIL